MDDLKQPRIKVGIALRLDQRDGLREVAKAERHGNVSLIVQRAIDNELDRFEREKAEADLKAVA